MKILFILNSLELGGAENYTVALMNNMVNLGHEISLRVLSDKLTLKYKLNPSINLGVFKRNYSIDIGVIKKLVKDINKNDYQVIISSSVIYTRLVMFFTKKEIPIFYPIHSTISMSIKYSIINYIFFKTKYKKEIFISSVENQTDYLCKEYKLPKNFFEQIYNGVDVNHFNLKPNDFNRREFLSQYGINPSDIIILMVAGYRPEKGHITAIEAFKMLSKEIPSARLVFVGNDPFNNKTKIEEEVLGFKGKVDVFSNVNEEDLKRFYWCAELFTLTSISETFPISSLEAMATGLPSVLTNVGGTKNIVFSEFNGELSVVNDPFSIKESWKKVLLNKHQYTKQNIRKYVVDNYSLDIATSNYIKLIMKYINN